jgi:hypothetical protein
MLEWRLQIGQQTSWSNSAKPDWMYLLWPHINMSRNRTCIHIIAVTPNIVHYYSLIRSLSLLSSIVFGFEAVSLQNFCGGKTLLRLFLSPDPTRVGASGTGSALIASIKCSIASSIKVMLLLSKVQQHQFCIKWCNANGSSYYSVLQKYATNNSKTHFNLTLWSGMPSVHKKNLNREAPMGQNYHQYRTNVLEFVYMFTTASTL